MRSGGCEWCDALAGWEQTALRAAGGSDGAVGATAKKQGKAQCNR